MNEAPQFEGPPIILWDTETTGLSQSAHRIVEIALMAYPYTANHTHHLTTFVQPSLSYPSLTNSTFRSASASTSTSSSASSAPTFYNPHALRRRMVSSSAFRAPTFATVWHMILAFVNRVTLGRPEQRPILVAHNMPFDLRFLRAEVHRIGEQLPDWDFACSLRDVVHVVWPGQPASLAALVDRFQISHNEPHRALPDVKATAEVLTHADDVLRRRERAASKYTPTGPTKIKKPSLRPHGAYVAELLHKAALQRRDRLEKEKKMEEDDANTSSVVKAISMVSFTPNHQHKKKYTRASSPTTVASGCSSLISTRSQRRAQASTAAKQPVVEDESVVECKKVQTCTDDSDSHSDSSHENNSDESSDDDDVTRDHIKRVKSLGRSVDDESDSEDDSDDDGSLIMSDREDEVKKESKPEYAYVSPNGYLWHRNRACHKLDAAFTILRKDKPPAGKKACPACKHHANGPFQTGALCK